MTPILMHCALPLVKSTKSYLRSVDIPLKWCLSFVFKVMPLKHQYYNNKSVILPGLWRQSWKAKQARWGQPGNGLSLTGYLSSNSLSLRPHATAYQASEVCGHCLAQNKSNPLLHSISQSRYSFSSKWNTFRHHNGCCQGAGGEGDGPLRSDPCNPCSGSQLSSHSPPPISLTLPPGCSPPFFPCHRAWDPDVCLLRGWAHNVPAPALPCLWRCSGWKKSPISTFSNVCWHNHKWKINFP